MSRFRSPPRSSWQAAITIVAVMLVAGGAFSLSWPHLLNAWRRHEGVHQNAADLNKAEAHTTHSPEMQLGTPLTVTLPRLQINMPVAKGTYHPSTQTWTIDSKHAFYLVPPDGATATPIIYGHDNPKVFMALGGVAPNEVLYITNTFGKALLFRYVSDITLDPTDIGILTAYYPKSVLLLTCSGIHFEHRRVMRFEYVVTSDASQQGIAR